MDEKLNEKVLVVIPYFGKLPNWFQTFLDSAANTQLLEFLLITDDHTLYYYPSNFTVEYMEFNKLQEKFYNKLGQIYLEHPYKLCDYKPFYGYVFDSYISQYGYWGYCDVDIIFGDIDKFLIQIDFRNYERIGKSGHFTLYKNDRCWEKLFLQQRTADKIILADFQFVSNTTYPCHFDEIGTNIICEESGIKFFKFLAAQNVNMSFYNFFVAGGKPSVPELLFYDSGQLYVVEQDSSANPLEMMYLHLQNRSITKNIIPTTSKYLITAEGFVDASSEKWQEYFGKYGDNKNETYQRLHVDMLKKKLQSAKRTKLIRELRTYPLTCIYNLYQRRKGINWLVKNGMF